MIFPPILQGKFAENFPLEIHRPDVLERFLQIVSDANSPSFSEYVKRPGLAPLQYWQLQLTHWTSAFISEVFEIRAAATLEEIQEERVDAVIFYLLICTALAKLTQKYDVHFARVLTPEGATSINIHLSLLARYSQKAAAYMAMEGKPEVYQEYPYDSLHAVATSAIPSLTPQALEKVGQKLKTRIAVGNFI